MAVNKTNNVGSVGLTEGPVEILFTRDRGYETSLEFTAPRGESLTKLQALVAAGYSPVRMRHAGGDLYLVTADSAVCDSSGVPVASSYDTYIKTDWSVPGNSIEKDIWELPSVKTALDQIPTHYGSATDLAVSKGIHGIAFIRSLVDAFVSGQANVTLVNEDGVEAESSLSVQVILNECALRGMDSTGKTTIRKLIGSMARGVTKFPVAQWVLRRTQTGPINSSLRGVRTNVNRMYTTSALQTAESPPSTLLDGIPTGYWLKQSPQVGTENDRLRVDQEWWWAEDYDRFTLGDPIT